MSDEQQPSNPLHLLIISFASLLLGYLLMKTLLAPKTDAPKKKEVVRPVRPVSSVAPNTVFYTAEEVSKHNKPSDIWFIVEKKVYNVTAFANKHPGGPEAFYKWAGKDCTEAFHNAPAHSVDRANEKEILSSYFVGDWRENEEVPASAKSDEAASTDNSSNDNNNKKISS